MNVSLFLDDLTELRSDLCALLCFEDRLTEGTLFQACAKALDGGEGALLPRWMAEEQFKGKKGQTLRLQTGDRLGAQRLLLVGGGTRGELQPADLRLFAAATMKAAAQVSARRVTIVLPYFEGAGYGRATQFLAEGALLGRYRFDRYLSEKRPRDAVEEIVLAASRDNVDAGLTDSILRGWRRGESVAAAVARARDLVNEPAAEATPTRLAEVAKEIAAQHGLEAKILGPRECEKLGMGMFLGVARGSDEEPRFIHLAYHPKTKAAGRKKVVLVGKGVTFDSGGLSLKPSNAMEDMKTDMAGAAAVLAAIGLVAELGSPHEVHALAACTENMPSGKAYRLGDVLTAMSGKTVEINNTDAEGRLTLGDALTYGRREIQPDEMFDFATLTGACVVALGPHIAGVMGNDNSLVERWLNAARLAGEEMWRLPLPERLKDQLKSEIADMKNTGERYGGALTAGLFLREFVGTTPWVHIDIAGPSSADKEYGHIAKGGTGFAVATIAEYLAPRE